MFQTIERWQFIARKSFFFGLRVLRRFFGQNKGFLLAGAVGYNMLLSVVPLFGLLLIALSAFFDKAVILQAVTAELAMVLPGQEQLVADALGAFIDERQLIGGIGLLIVIFFSSIAFRILQDALSVIFEHHHDKIERHFLVSAIIPYVYVVFIGLSLATLTFLTGFLETFDGAQFELFNQLWQVSSIGPLLTRLFGVTGMILMFSSVYVVMPTARIQLKRAVVGGITAAFLWELVRTVLVWYFENLSLVSVVYGSLATVIIVLLSMELLAIITLLGAQTIAELERAERARVPWWANPDKTRAKLVDNTPTEEPAEAALAEDEAAE